MFLAIFPYISCVAQLCLTLCDRMDCTLPGSSVHGLLQARILLQAREWVAIPFFRGSSRSRDWTLVSCIAGRFFTVWATRYFMSQQHLWVIHFLFINSPSSLDFQHSTPLRFPPTLGFNFPLASSSSQTPLPRPPRREHLCAQQAELDYLTGRHKDTRRNSRLVRPLPSPSQPSAGVHPLACRVGVNLGLGNAEADRVDFIFNEWASVQFCRSVVSDSLRSHES